MEKDPTRFFDRLIKDACWNKLHTVVGRDPNRWRFDATGQNVVCRNLTACEGPLCHEYDHIFPHSQGGRSSLENCQVLQSRVNRYKSDGLNVPEQNQSYSTNYTFTEEELDLVEMSVYGNIKRSEQRCRCKSFLEMSETWHNLAQKSRRHRKIDGMLHCTPPAYHRQTLPKKGDPVDSTPVVFEDRLKKRRESRERSRSPSDDLNGPMSRL